MIFIINMILLIINFIEKNKNFFKKKKISEEKICTICLISNFESNEIFHNYSENLFTKTMIKICECKPEVHQQCFLDYIKMKNKCLICSEPLYFDNNTRLKYFLIIFQYLVQTFQITINLSLLYLFLKLCYIL